MKGKERSRTRSGLEEAHRAQTAYRYVQLVSESPHPLKRVPGIKHCRWWADIGRWVKV